MSKLKRTIISTILILGVSVNVGAISHAIDKGQVLEIDMLNQDIELSENMYFELENHERFENQRLSHIERSEIEFHGMEFTTNCTNFFLDFYTNQTEHALNWLKSDEERTLLEGFDCTILLSLHSLYSQKDISENRDELERKNFVSDAIKSDLELVIDHFSSNTNNYISDFIVNDHVENVGEMKAWELPTVEIVFLTQNTGVVIGRTSGLPTVYLVFEKVIENE